jgi:hypothetical protein
MEEPMSTLGYSHRVLLWFFTRQRSTPGYESEARGWFFCCDLALGYSAIYPVSERL